MHLRQAVRAVISLITVQTILMAAQQGAVQPGVVASAVTGRPVTTGNKAVTKTQLAGSKMPMPLVAPLFIQDETTDSEITIVSNFSKSLGVDVVLSGSSGEQLAKEKVQMEPYSQKKLKISDLLARGQSDANARYGSVLLMADRPASLAAQLSIVDNSKPSPADVEEEFVMLMDSKPADYRAVTSGLSTMPILAIRSLSAAEQKVSVRCLMQHGGDRSTNIAIPPNQTVLVQVCNAREAKQINRVQDALEDTSNFTNVVGVAVSSSASSEELAVFGVGLHGKGSSGTLSAIPFWDVNTLNSSSAVYPGVLSASGGVLRSGSFKLRVALANFSNLPKTATVLTASGSGRDSTGKTVATLKLPANSVSTTDLTDVSQDPLATKSVVVQTDGRPGEVLSDIQAVADSNAAVPATTLPWKDQGQAENGGEHPWTVDRSTSSTVLLFNPDPALTNSQIHLTIHAGSSTWTKQLSLAPLSTISISLNDIIQKQQPDDNGIRQSNRRVDRSQGKMKGLEVGCSPTRRRTFFEAMNG
jgi:hypothetical protein